MFAWVLGSELSVGCNSTRAFAIKKAGWTDYPVLSVLVPAIEPFLRKYCTCVPSIDNAWCQTLAACTIFHPIERVGVLSDGRDKNM